MNKRLLVLGGSRQAAAGLDHLQQQGFELVLCDMDAKAPGRQYCTHFIKASVYHIDECLPAVEAFHSSCPVDGVMCLACDVPHVVARIAEALKLPGNPVEVADRAVDKLAMKQKFQADGVNTPAFWQVTTEQELRQIQSDVRQTLVVKPVDSRGSKGVSRLLVGDDPAWAFNYALSNSETARVMAEEYIDGPQVSTESVVIDGEAVTPAYSDRSYEFLERYHPYIVENGGDMPSNLPEQIIDRIRELINEAAASLGVKNGIVKGDIVVRDGIPYVIELAARLSGGYFCTHQIPLSTGVHLVEANARLAVGERLCPREWEPKFSKHVSTRWKLLEPGRIVEIPDVKPILAMDGVRYFEHWLNEADVIEDARNAAASVAMVQAEGSSRSDTVAYAETALEAFNPRVETSN